MNPKIFSWEALAPRNANGLIALILLTLVVMVLAFSFIGMLLTKQIVATRNGKIVYTTLPNTKVDKDPITGKPVITTSYNNAIILLTFGATEDKSIVFYEYKKEHHIYVTELRDIDENEKEDIFRRTKINTDDLVSIYIDNGDLSEALSDSSLISSLQKLNITFKNDSGVSLELDLFNALEISVSGSSRAVEFSSLKDVYLQSAYVSMTDGSISMSVVHLKEKEYKNYKIKQIKIDSKNYIVVIELRPREVYFDGTQLPNNTSVSMIKPVPCLGNKNGIEYEKNAVKFSDMNDNFVTIKFLIPDSVNGPSRSDVITSIKESEALLETILSGGRRQVVKTDWKKYDPEKIIWKMTSKNKTCSGSKELSQCLLETVLSLRSIFALSSFPQFSNKLIDFDNSTSVDTTALLNLINEMSLEAFKFYILVVADEEDTIKPTSFAIGAVRSRNFAVMSVRRFLSSPSDVAHEVLHLIGANHQSGAALPWAKTHAYIQNPKDKDDIIYATLDAQWGRVFSAISGLDSKCNGETMSGAPDQDNVQSVADYLKEIRTGLGTREVADSQRWSPLGSQYVTTPPVTKPPVTKPPVTKPPVTKPPVTKPPVTKPPVTPPPVTPAPVTPAPVTKPPVTPPPVTPPPVTKPTRTIPRPTLNADNVPVVCALSEICRQSINGTLCIGKEDLNVYFGTGSSILKSRMQLLALEKLKNAISHNKSKKILLLGYADPRGNEAFNCRLSAKRIGSVLSNVDGVINNIEICPLGESQYTACRSIITKFSNARRVEARFVD